MRDTPVNLYLFVLRQQHYGFLNQIIYTPLRICKLSVLQNIFPFLLSELVNYLFTHQPLTDLQKPNASHIEEFAQCSSLVSLHTPSTASQMPNSADTSETWHCVHLQSVYTCHLQLCIRHTFYTYQTQHSAHLCFNKRGKI